MADSPETNASDVLKLTLYSDGSELDTAFQVVSVTVYKAVNRIPHARLVFLDGDMPEKDFPLSNSDEFKPGKLIKINAGYGSTDETIFEGVIVKQGIKVRGSTGAELVVECRDKTVAMTLGRKNANYVDSKDSDIITTLIGNYSGLSSTVEATTTENKELVQYYSSDWDFMLSRAEACGLLVIVDDSAVTVKPPQTDASAVLTVTYGEDMLEFSADVDAHHQLKSVKSSCWNPADQAIVEQEVSPQTLNSQGDLSSSDLADVLGLDDFLLQTPVTLESTALTDWALSQQIKSGLARIRGRAKFQGSAVAKVGSLIEVAGVGNHFNGDVYVSSVNHVIQNGNWFTEVEFGLAADWFADRRDLTAPPASGLLPGVEGLQIGVVKKLDEDPNSENRIQVTIPLMQADTEGVWARLASYYCSSTFGNFFIPEIGDEVIIGYMNGDPSSPVILGSVYSSNHAPPYSLTAENNTKAIVTRSELKVEFDDDKKVITIITPSENKLVFSDDAKSITMEDQTGNKLEMSESGISITSPKDISIKADGSITVEATSNLDMSSSGSDATLKALNVTAEAEIGMTAKGNASAEFSASGQTTVKGAMVMIN